MRKRHALLTTLFAMIAFLAFNADAWGQTTETTTYIFNSKEWKATPANWTSGKDGSQYNTQNQGVQVTTGTTGANATSPISFSNISKIDVKYCTNAKSGEGTIKLQVGTGTAKTFSVTAPSSGGTDLKTATFDYSTAETGYVKLTVDCTTNSIYISSVAITYSNIPHTVTFDAGTGTCESTSLSPL